MLLETEPSDALSKGNDKREEIPDTVASRPPLKCFVLGKMDSTKSAVRLTSPDWSFVTNHKFSTSFINEIYKE